MIVLQIHNCILYNRSKYTELLLVTANEQRVQQFYPLDLNPDNKFNFLEENQRYRQAGIIFPSPLKELTLVVN